ncbi:MAG: hypothetical protein SOY67_00760 [Collinsella sp.]|nr:hypothetical protein [Collinsella sp.]
MQGRNAGAVALTIIAWGARLTAIALAAITVILCVSGLTARLNMVGLVVDLSRALPAVIAGYGVITTPFGGIFRLDFALIVLFLLFLDYACLRAAQALRRR